MEVNSPRDLTTGQASGKRQYLPILIQKATGPASMQFFNAITHNEQLTVTFEVYRFSLNSAVILDYKIVLTNAGISKFKQSFIEGQKGFIDSIGITFQKIELSIGGISTSDTWQVMEQ